MMYIAALFYVPIIVGLLGNIIVDLTVPRISVYMAVFTIIVSTYLAVSSGEWVVITPMLVQLIMTIIFYKDTEKYVKFSSK